VPRQRTVGKTAANQREQFGGSKELANTAQIEE
jgi:hypothetical protein